MLVSAIIAAPALAADDEFLVVRRSMQIENVRLTAIENEHLVHLPPDRQWERVPLADVLALINIQSERRPQMRGMLTLADGQRFPGEPAIKPGPPTPPGEERNAAGGGGGSAHADETFGWSHPWLGRMDIPLSAIETIVLVPGAQPPPPGRGDVVLLRNGDKREGFIVAAGDPLSLEIGEGAERQVTEISLQLVIAITLASQRQATAGRRVWFNDGTVLDVESIVVGDDHLVRLAGPWLSDGVQPTRIGLSDIAAILFDPGGMAPLAGLPPTRVEGPSTRYTLPPPEAVETDAPLGLSSILYRGPIVVRYGLPAGSERLSAEAVLPESARDWGDLELVIESNDAEVFRARLNAQTPTALINIALRGRELTIRVEEAAHGPIQDEVLLKRPMLMKKR